jgi:hypothetical protein
LILPRSQLDIDEIRVHHNRVHHFVHHHDAVAKCAQHELLGLAASVFFTVTVFVKTVFPVPCTGNEDFTLYSRLVAGFAFTSTVLKSFT